MKFIKFFIAILLLTSCSKYINIFKNQIEGRKLTLIDMSGYTKSSSANITLTINKDTFYGNSGCNEYSGVFLINKNFVHFSLDNVGTKVCQNLEDEKQYLRKLVKTTSITIRKSKAYFKDRDGKNLLMFK